MELDRSSTRRGVYSDARTRVLLAVVRQARPTIRSVGAATGLRSTTTVWRHLGALRRDGFVTWDARRSGTLRPLVVEVSLNEGGGSVGG